MNGAAVCSHGVLSGLGVAQYRASKVDRAGARLFGAKIN